MLMNIILRNIQEADLEKIMNWRMLPEVTKYMYTDPELTIEDQKRWYKRISLDKNCKYWIIQVNNIDIGLMCLTEIDEKNSRCGWAYYIADTSFRGKGLAGILECNIYDYVFYELKLNKLWCEVLAFNEKVIYIHKKFGSEIEGVLRQHIYKNGQFYDVVIMAILKEKWDNIRKKYDYEKINIEE